MSDKKKLPSIDELKNKIEKSTKLLEKKTKGGPITERLKLFLKAIEIQRDNGMTYPDISKLIEEETGFQAHPNTIRKFYLEHAEKPSSQNNQK